MRFPAGIFLPGSIPKYDNLQQMVTEQDMRFFEISVKVSQKS